MPALDAHCDINLRRLETRVRKRLRMRHAETDRAFAWLMVFQLIVGILTTLLISPHTWIGTQSAIHVHVWAAIILGGSITALPVLLTYRYPGQTVTRHVVAVAQMLWSALLIHLTGGRIETHFHVFGSLAFLAFYRDWKVLLTAGLVVAVDHLFRGVYWPQSVFGVQLASPFRWMEHAGWVVFETMILMLSCQRGMAELREICRRQLQLEQAKQERDQQILEQTLELRKANQRLSAEVSERRSIEERELQFGRLIENSDIEVYIFNSESLCFCEVNHAGLCNLGYTIEELRQLTPVSIQRELPVQNLVRILKPMLAGEITHRRLESRHHRKDGSQYPVEIHLQMSEWNGRPAFMAIALDISARRTAETERDEVQKQLVNASHFAGMAEIATGVLHNVGNVLNSVNVSAMLIQETVDGSRCGNLHRVTDLLHEHENDLDHFLHHDPRGPQILPYLRELSDTLSRERTTVLEELGVLTSSVNHIKEIVQAQQANARVGGTVETLQLEDVLEEALRVEVTGLERHGIRIVRDYEYSGPLQTQKHKLLQILVNLIGNAKKAIDESASRERILTLRTRQQAACLLIECSDTGCGIAVDHLERVFSHGFTTRSDGHGFGLHSSANAATELGGSLTVSSPGIGRGATFCIELPLPPPAAPADSLAGQNLAVDHYAPVT